MYNRYIPQPDGSYRRDRVQDMRPPQRTPTPPPPPKPKPCEVPEQPPCPPSKKTPPPRQMPNRQPPKQEPAGNFFKQLLPRELDTADLLIILLLLLMAGDNEEDRSNALLTLALYFFM